MLTCAILGNCPESHGRSLPRGGSQGPAPSEGSKGPGGIGGGVEGTPPDSPRNRNLEQDKVTLSNPEARASQPELPNFAAAYGA